MRSFTIFLFGLLWMVPETPKPVIGRIGDPYQAEYFSCAGKVDGRLFNNAHENFGYNDFRIVADLSFDGRKDVILSTSDRNGGTGCGNATCDATIYLKQPDGKYMPLGFGLHPGAVALRKIKAGIGQLVTYSHSGADLGLLNFYKVTLNSISVIRRETLHTNSSDKDKALYESWFFGDQALNAEYAHCHKGQIEWNGSYQ